MGRIEEIDKELEKLDSKRDALLEEKESLTPKKIKTRGDPVVEFS